MGKDYWYCNLKFQVESHISLKIQFIAVSTNTSNLKFSKGIWQPLQNTFTLVMLATNVVSERSFSLFLFIKASTCMCGQILGIIDFPVCPQEYNCSLFSVTLSRKKTESRNWQIACMRYSKLGYTVNSINISICHGFLFSFSTSSRDLESSR